ncbi:MAG: hypothetical protein NVSMB56_13800 [Pyrinomonadaceae bacterium]
MTEKSASLPRRATRAVGWKMAKRLIKPIPIVGTMVAVGLAGYEIKKKGLLRGSIDVGLDIIPFVGTAKNVIELFTGDLIPDKETRRRATFQIIEPRSPRRAG